MTADVMVYDHNMAYAFNEVSRKLSNTGDQEMGGILVCRLYKKMGSKGFM